MNLQTRSLLKLTERTKNIPELLSLIRSSPIILDTAHRNVDFWRLSLSRLHEYNSKRLLLQRGDLVTGEQWEKCFEALARGEAYAYSWFIHMERNEDGDYRNAGQSFSPTFSDADTEGYGTVIYGTLPQQTYGLFFSLWTFRGSKIDKDTFIFGSPDTLIERALRWALTVELPFGNDYSDISNVTFDTHEVAFTAQVKEDGVMELVIQELVRRIDRRLLENKENKILFDDGTTEYGISFSKILPFP